MTEPITPEQLAQDLGMLQPDDVQVCVSDVLGLDLHTDEIPPEIAAEVRSVLDPHGERTAPARLYWPGHPAQVPRRRSPTDDEGFYPDTQDVETP
jgi:hypothetical protein